MTDYRSNHNTLESMSQAVWYNKWTLKKFENYLQGDILEVGCGIGNFTQTLSTYGKVWAFDNDSFCVSETKKLKLPNVSVGMGDIEKNTFFFKDKKFNVVVCMNVLEHIERDSQSLKHISQLLKPHGYCIVLVPIHKWLYGSIDKSIHHFRRYSETDLIDKLQSNKLTLIWKRRLNLLGSVGWFISGKLLHSKGVAMEQLQLFNTFAPFLLPLEDIFEPRIGTSLLIVSQKSV